MGVEFNVVRLTNGPKHHFFGFHDLEISSHKTGFSLVLSVDKINRPPTSNDIATVCVINPENIQDYREITTTSTYNFPQGARQQWLGDTDNFIVNQAVDNKLISSIYDAISGMKISQIDTGTHVVGKGAKISYSIDYGRLHRLGGYGYVGITDQYADEAAPLKSGIFATDIETNQTELILSIAEVVENNEKANRTSSHHFFTHLSLSPSGKRIAFLHRYRLPDGGEDTCLMTVDIDGSNCRLLAQGFFSHFDWKDNNSIIIWGRESSTISDLRNNIFLQNPLLHLLLKGVKKIVRPMLSKTSAMNCSFLLISDELTPRVQEIAKGILQTDGHPMINPKNRNWLIIDNYPNDKGIRDLMLYSLKDNKKISLGQYPMSNETPSKEIINRISHCIKESITVPFSLEQYAFTRSGLHCDLHPRWFANGGEIAFDSIHEGTRQVYAINVESYI